MPRTAGSRGSKDRIDPERLPGHIGIIMDGNGRWAKRRGLSRTEGHRAGSRSVRKVVRACRRMGIRHLTLFAFSSQNWGRPADEVRALMELLSEFIIKEWREIMERDIKVIHLGELGRVPAGVRRQLGHLVAATRGNRSMTLALALSYGSREELVRAANRLVAKARRGRARARGVDEAALARELYTARLPDPDLIIRSGGERRLSNFLLWQGAYAELHFSDKLWPDFSERDLNRAIADFQRRRRRFGLTDEQVAQLRKQR